MIKNNIVDLLLGLLQSPHRDVRQASLDALGNFAKHGNFVTALHLDEDDTLAEELRTSILATNVINLLDEILRSEDHELHLSAEQLLKTLSDGESPHTRMATFSPFCQNRTERSDWDCGRGRHPCYG
jgi:HEAT repeat